METKTCCFFFFVSCCLTGFLLSVPQATAQTIHLVIAADIKSPDIGLIAAIDQGNIEYLFRMNVPARQLEVTKIPVEKLSPEGVRAVIDGLKLTEEDTLVFYYSGHSSFDTENPGQFFKFPHGNLYRADLLKQLHEKSSRLSVLLSDCCNNPLGKGVVIGSETNRRSLPSMVMPPLFDSLFLRAKGTVDITSSKIGELSFCDVRSTGNRGSCFTWSLVELMNDNKDNTEMNWAEFVAILVPAVDRSFRENYPDGFGAQKTQTVTPLDYPGMNRENKSPSPSDATKEKYRFGVRVTRRSGGGFLILDVYDDSPARRSGLESGDVILEINGKPVNTEEEFSDAVDLSGERMNIKLINVRTGKTLEQKVRLGK